MAWLLYPDKYMEPVVEQCLQDPTTFRLRPVPKDPINKCLVTANYSLILSHQLLKSKLSAEFSALLEMEMKITQILASMEYRGMGFVDSSVQYKEQIKSQIKHLEKTSIYRNPCKYQKFCLKKKQQSRVKKGKDINLPTRMFFNNS
jgi:DNA polymerase I-like protein with 3'-5' exonuclease and polymerase domains